MPKRTKRLTSQGEEQDEVRINKYLSEAGVCSRREADRYIADGKVGIDGEIAKTGSKVQKDSVVTFCGKEVKKVDKLALIAFHKPVGIVCTTDTSEPDNIIDFISYNMRIFPIGRLDKDSEGLILLTNDGNIVNKILRAENAHEKEYIVRVNKEITVDFMKQMSGGVPILDTVTNPCTVNQIDRFTFRIILTQGLNRQIRRMCEVCGYQVTSLARIRIMNIQLGRLKPGDYRNVTEKEIEELMDQIQQSKHVVVNNKTLPEKEAFANKATKGTRKPGVYQSAVSKKSYGEGKSKEKSVNGKKNYGEGKPKEKNVAGKKSYGEEKPKEKNVSVKKNYGEGKSKNNSVAGKKSYGEGKPKEKSVGSKKSYGEGKPKEKSVTDRPMGNKSGFKKPPQRNKRH